MARQNSLKTTKKRPLRYGVLILFCLISISLIPTTKGWAASSAISQSYQTNDTNIAQGALVSLASSKSGLVVPASSTTTATLVGIAASSSLVELSTGKQDSVQVIVGGTTNALVSDANGSIKVGDKITTSPVDGIGMRATSATEIVGTAQANLTSVNTVTESLTGIDGKKIAVKVGLLPVTVNVSYYSATSQGVISSFLPPFLQSIANAVTGQQVSPLRVLLGASALLIGFMTIGTMLYIAIRSEIISIGRNPLAEKALRKGLVSVIFAALGVLIITIAITYGILFS